MNHEEAARNERSVAQQTPASVDKLRIEILTRDSGHCIGIQRAYREMSRRASAEAPFTVTHQNSANPFDTLRRIERREPELLARYPGLDRLSVKYDPSEVEANERLVLGFHGLPPEEKDALNARGVDIVADYICPFIAKLDKLVERHVAAGFDVAMVGSPDNHHLRTAAMLAARQGRRCFPIIRAEDVDALPCSDEDGPPIVLMGQVTGNTQVFHETIARIETLRLPIKIVKTMCSDSYRRQTSAFELAQRADLVVLVDDGGDGALSVYEVCRRANSNIYRVRQASDVKREWFSGVKKVAVVGGILVPDWTIAEVSRQIAALSECTIPALSTNSSGKSGVTA
jgi:(E)-4-hydroxy-3-methyl-but-2-enyl pyrophosphate reductase